MRIGPKRSFTLVEMLVAVAIVAVLAGILFPSLQGAYRRALGVKCVQNERTLFNATMSYVQDNDGRLPPYTAAPQWVMYGLQPYVDFWKIQCPLYPWRSLPAYTALAVTNIFRCTYSYNSSAWYFGWSPNATPRLVAIRRPSRTGMWVDAGVKMGNPEPVPVWARTYANGGDFTSTAYPIAPWHQGGLNVVFFDGHAAVVTQEQLQAMDPNPETPQSPFSNSILQ